MATTASGDLRALRLSHERPAATQSGYLMLLVLLVALVVGGVGLWLAAEDNKPLGASIGIFSMVVLLFVACGFYFLQPNQAAAILLFGDYKGTDRTAGLRWVLPWLTRTKISTRVHNVT